MSARILIADDELPLRRAVRRALEGHGYTVREAATGGDALEQLETFKPDVLLLDVGLPDMTGVEVCKTVRLTSQTPIIVLSVLGDERTKVAALDEGADDYVTKPFGMDELLARIRVALRRGASNRSQSPAIEAGRLRIDLETRTVRLDERIISLTPTEYSLLKYLVTNAGKVLTHQMILRAVWGRAYENDNHVLRTCINQLRMKLEEDSADPKYIRTEMGVGYRFLDPQVS
jgi:two-component system KDP operon response regulator KdpE